MLKPKEYFSFNRNEYRGILVFAVIIVSLIIFRLFFAPHIGKNKPISDEAYEEWMSSIDRYDSLNQLSAIDLNNKPNVNLQRDYFRFNPNTANQETLKTLGFSSYQITNITKYRNAGGRFNEPDDLFRIYGIDSVLVAELLNYVQIPQENTENTTKESNTFHTKEINKEKKDINSADSSDLMEIRGIGLKRSGTIINFRQKLGGFVSTEQFSEIYHLPDSLALALSKAFVIDTTKLRRINVNKASFKEFIQHPYMNKQQTLLILEYREANGSIQSVNELFQNPSLNLELNPLLRYYLSSD
jgi:competence protein ComEA